MQGSVTAPLDDLEATREALAWCATHARAAAAAEEELALDLVARDAEVCMIATAKKQSNIMFLLRTVHSLSKCYLGLATIYL